MRFTNRKWRDEDSTRILAKISHFNERSNRHQIRLVRGRILTWGQAYANSLKFYASLDRWASEQASDKTIPTR